MVSTSASQAAGQGFDSGTRHVSLLGVKTWLSTLEIVYLCVFQSPLFGNYFEDDNVYSSKRHCTLTLNHSSIVYPQLTMNGEVPDFLDHLQTFNFDYL